MLVGKIFAWIVIGIIVAFIGVIFYALYLIWVNEREWDKEDNP